MYPGALLALRAMMRMTHALIEISAGRKGPRVVLTREEIFAIPSFRCLRSHSFPFPWVEKKPLH